MRRDLTLIHTAKAMSLVQRMDDPEAHLEALAVYLAPVSVLLAARKDASALDPFIQQAADLDPQEAADMLKDFFEKFTRYSMALGGSLVGMTDALTRTPGGPSSS